MRIVIPRELLPYISIRDWKITIIKEIPDELKASYDKFSQDFEKIIEYKNNEITNFK